MSRYRPNRDMGVIAPRSAASAAPPTRRRHTSFARLVGAIGLLTLTAVLFWLLTDDAFRVSEANVTFEGLRHADEAEVRAYLTDLDRAPNVFRVRASDIVSELSTLTEVDAASATVILPASVSVHLDERDPIFIWSDGDAAWLVDEEGMLFAPGEPTASSDDPGGDPAAPIRAAKPRPPKARPQRVPTQRRHRPSPPTPRPGLPCRWSRTPASWSHLRSVPICPRATSR